LDTDQLVWSVAQLLSKPADDETPLVACRNLDDKGITEVFVHADGFDGLFALTAREFDRMELNVLAARVATTDDGHSWNVFQLMDANSRALNPSDRGRLASALTEQLGQRNIRPLPGRPIPRRLKHFLMRSEIAFERGNETTRLEIATTDRPGLLSAIAESLLGAGVRLHDARIATFGQRVEDVFVITTVSGQPLDDEVASKLEQELRTRLDPEVRAPSTAGCE
jgi:[protein-PII] uridylyltransferase